MKKTFIAVPVLASLFLAGCSTITCFVCGEEEEEEPTYEHRFEETKKDRVAREHNTDWANNGRGGAALRQPAYIFVLGDGNVNAVRGADISKGDSEDLSAAISALAAQRYGSPGGAGEKGELSFKDSSLKPSSKGYSYYEMQRWSRFCDFGKGMDEDDWMFIAGEGAVVPNSLATICQPPNYNRADYYNAWNDYCSNQTLSKKYLQVVRDTVAPKGIRESCPPLKQQ